MVIKTKPDFIGDRIRKIRKERSLTQSELASRIGIIQSDLCRMEKGEYKVGLDVLFRILGVFGMGIAEFFNEGTPEVSVAEGEVLRRFRALDPGAQGEVLEFLKFKEQQLLRENES